MARQLGIEFMYVSIGGHAVTGWSDDSDCLMMPDDWEGYNTKYGAAGEMRVYRTGRKGGEVTIKLLPGSRSAIYWEKEFANVLNNKNAVDVAPSRFKEGTNPQDIKVYNGFVEDSINGHRWVMERGILTKGPLGQTIGSGDASNREFTFEFERIYLIPDKIVDTENLPIVGATGSTGG